MNYAIRNNRVIQVKFYKRSNKKTSCWVHIIGVKKPKLISNKNLFDNFEEAEKELRNRQQRKQLLEEKIQQEIKVENEKKFKVVNRIYVEYGVEIPYIIWDSNSLNDLKRYYNELRNKKHKY